MNLPSGLVFYLDFKYGTTANGFTKGQSVFGDTGPLTTSGSTAPYGVGGFYGSNTEVSGGSYQAMTILLVNQLLHHLQVLSRGKL